MSDPRLVMIDSLGEVVTGSTPPAAHPEWFAESGTPFITPSDVEDGVRFVRTARFLSPLGVEAMRKRVIPADSVCFVSIGSTIGKMCTTTTPSVTNQQINSIVVDNSIADSTFVYYALAQRAASLKAIAGGSATPILNKSAFAAVKLSILAVEDQRVIGSLLNSLDDKIESNSRVVATVESLMKLQFLKSIEAERCEQIPLAELAKAVKGVSYKSIDLKPSRTALVTLKSFDRNGGYKPEGLKPYIGRYKPQQVIEPGEIAIALTDLTQGAEVVGRAVRVPADRSADVLVASLDLTIVRPVEAVLPEYLLGILTDEAFRLHCRSRTSGTTVLHLASDAIPSYLAPVTPLSAQRVFADLASPLLQRVDSLSQETEHLIALREALLPALLSGRIRMPEAQKAHS